MEISIVTSLYKSENYILEFYDKMIEAAKSVTNDFEIIFIDDASPDKSSQIVDEIIKKDKNIRLVSLSTNAGAAAARWEGLKYCRGKYVFLIDADLEEDPFLLVDFYERIKLDLNTDVVYGYLENRKGSFIEKISGWIFYKIFRIFSGLKFEGSPTWARLMSQRYSKSLLKFNEQHLFAIGIMKIVGFNQIGVPILKKSKRSTSYTTRSKLSQTVNSILSFSNRPLIILSLVGLLISFFSFVLFLLIIFQKIFVENYIDGWTSLIASIFLMGGINLLAIGIAGLYIGKNYDQAKNRPRVIIKSTNNLEIL
jgi:putative glycosyltransferase